MGNPGGGGRGDEAERVSRLVGELLIGLGEKVRAAGPEGVRVLTEEELQRQQLNWFRDGWHEHARATEPPGADAPSALTDSDSGADDGRRRHPDSEHFPLPPTRLLHFPERPPFDGRGGHGRD
ncbi:hypothetical protein [Streptomyces sp. NPDC048825]|uniref:hypothetical protein n=1 Tax=Streptomyces sp. NPDC048825 TaxID=3365592 RepID=UPI003713BF49